MQGDGLSAIALRNSAHIGRVGDFAEMAAAEGLVSAHFVNAAGSILVAPFGATSGASRPRPFRRHPEARRFAPHPRFRDSLVAEGKALVASRGGKKLPADALIGPDGEESGDPRLLYGEYEPTGPRNHGLGKGAIRAFGEHKGSGLALMCELIGGALTGNGATEPDRRFSNGMLSISSTRNVSTPRTSSRGDRALSGLCEECEAYRRRRGGAGAGRSRKSVPQRAHGERRPVA